MEKNKRTGVAPNFIATLLYITHLKKKASYSMHTAVFMMIGTTLICPGRSVKVYHPVFQIITIQLIFFKGMNFTGSDNIKIACAQGECFSATSESKPPAKKEKLVFVCMMDALDAEIYYY